MNGSAGVLYCGSASCIMTDKAAMMAEKTISRTENFLIGIFFAMVRFVLMKDVLYHDVKSNGKACQGANDGKQRHGLQSLIQFDSSKYADGNDE